MTPTNRIMAMSITALDVLRLIHTHTKPTKTKRELGREMFLRRLNTGYNDIHVKHHKPFIQNNIKDIHVF